MVSISQNMQTTAAYVHKFFSQLNCVGGGPSNAEEMVGSCSFMAYVARNYSFLKDVKHKAGD